VYLWVDDPTPPPHVAATVVDSGSATGFHQFGPLSSASVEGRLATSAQPVFVDISGQHSLGPRVLMSCHSLAQPTQPLPLRNISPAFSPLMLLLWTLHMAWPGLCLLMLYASLVSPLPLTLLPLTSCCTQWICACLHRCTRRRRGLHVSGDSHCTVAATSSPTHSFFGVVTSLQHPAVTADL